MTLLSSAAPRVGCRTTRSACTVKDTNCPALPPVLCRTSLACYLSYWNTAAPAILQNRLPRGRCSTSRARASRDPRAAARCTARLMARAPWCRACCSSWTGPAARSRRARRAACTATERRRPPSSTGVGLYRGVPAAVARKAAGAPAQENSIASLLPPSRPARATSDVAGLPPSTGPPLPPYTSACFTAIRLHTASASAESTGAAAP